MTTKRQSPAGAEQSDRRSRWSRRRQDHQVVKTLGAMVAFLLIVVAVLSFGLLHVAGRASKTAKQANKNSRATQIAFCLQTKAFRDAYNREKLLGQSAASARTRGAHARSARQLKRYLDQIEPVADCKHVKLPDSPSIFKSPSPQSSVGKKSQLANKPASSRPGGRKRSSKSPKTPGKTSPEPTTPPAQPNPPASPPGSPAPQPPAPSPVPPAPGRPPPITLTVPILPVTICLNQLAHVNC